jgi:putative sigma-54 modulation protein
MQISITARRIGLAEPFKMLVNEKLTKLTRHSSKIEKARVVFSLEKFNYISEIVLTGKNFNMASIEKDTDIKSSFDKSVTNIEKRLRKFRGKIRERSMKGFSPGLSKIRPKRDKRVVAAPAIIKTDSFAPKPMSPEDAASELEMFERDFVVFRNSRTEDVNVLYKRKDGNYGLIEP